MRTMRTLCLAGALFAGSASLVLAQSASTTGAGSASGDSGTVGTGGSAAVGGTSASTLGLGGRSGDSATIGSGGSAAAVEGKTKSDTKIHGNKNHLMGRSRARAQDGGTWSRSRTRTKIHKDKLTSRTRSMAHEPGGPPVKSTTRESVDLSR
jgi:hypothetical protein